MSRDEFEYWLIDMDNALAEFSTYFPEAERKQLDYSGESLNIVEQWLLRKYSNVQSAISPSEAPYIDKAARYVGETFRKHLGGYWYIELNNKKYVYFGLPQLRGKSNKCTPDCPHTMVTTCLDRRTGTFIQTVFKNSRPYDLPLMSS
jgi:hypothetical protein